MLRWADPHVRISVCLFVFVWPLCLQGLPAFTRLGRTCSPATLAVLHVCTFLRAHSCLAIRPLTLACGTLAPLRYFPLEQLAQGVGDGHGAIVWSGGSLDAAQRALSANVLPRASPGALTAWNGSVVRQKLGELARLLAHASRPRVSVWAVVCTMCCGCMAQICNKIHQRLACLGPVQ